ncbi:MAG TPA: ATP-binding protein [Candidatus Aquilonibacter sp.]|nr:ATP-binding protein [Candidatus Aquilonibacter sp.]
MRNATRMETMPSTSEWLPWLGRVRFLVITVLLAGVFAVHELTTAPPPTRAFVPLILLWYMLGAVCLLLQKRLPEARAHAPIQSLLDIVMITGVVYATGAQDSYFTSLYLLAILMGTILFSRRGAFLIAGGSFLFLSCVVELAFFGKIPPTATSHPDIRNLESWLAVNLFAFLAVAYLGTLLAQAIQKKGAELKEKNKELQDLQAFNQDIIESMRGGLLTTDADGTILLLNRAGAEITGHGFGLLRGEHVADVFPGFWPVDLDEFGVPLALRKEVEYHGPDGVTRFLGVSISPLRTAQNQASGFVFNFQDLTELKRLEKEVETKERMAALGRLSAAIAHEIRQPLTAMTGALKELARFAPLEDDDKKLVEIVSRESQRLNQIVTDFLDYSREKTYSFASLDIVTALEETLLLLERHVASSGAKIKISRAFPQRRIFARADRDAIKQVFWNLCNNALRAMPQGGTLTVGADEAPGTVRVAVRDTGIGISPAEAAKIFEPFQSSFTGGTGLGLAVVYRILQAHEGSIRVRSEKGKGAEFLVELQTAERPRPDRARPSQVARASFIESREPAVPVGKA